MVSVAMGEVRRRGILLVPGRFAALRARARWTQRDVADLLSVTERQVGRWERGEQNVPKMAWELLCLRAGVLAAGGDWSEPPAS